MCPGGDGDGQPSPQETIDDRQIMRDALEFIQRRERTLLEAYDKTVNVVAGSTNVLAALVNKLGSSAAGPPRTGAAAANDKPLAEMQSTRGVNASNARM